MRTVKELADSFKVSRQTIYNAIARDDIKKHTFKQDNLTLIDETGVELLEALFDKEKTSENSSGFQSEIQESVQVESDNLKGVKSADFWREQLSNKDKQISDLSNKFNDLFNQLKEKDKQIETILNQFAEKDNQINTAQRLLENQQKLQATQMITDGEKKISFWKKLFRKKDFSE